MIVVTKILKYRQMKNMQIIDVGKDQKDKNIWGVSAKLEQPASPPSTTKNARDKIREHTNTHTHTHTHM